MPTDHGPAGRMTAGCSPPRRPSPTFPALRSSPRVRRWTFSHADDMARAHHDAVSSAAVFLRDRRAELAAPAGANQVAVLAFEVHEAFVARDPSTGIPVVADPDSEVVRAAIADIRRR